MTDTLPASEETKPRELAPLAFIDIETTGLNRELCEVWEVAIITADPYPDGSGYKETEHLWQPEIKHFYTAEETALRLTHFYERNEQFKARDKDDLWRPEKNNATIAHEFTTLTAGRTLVGAVPNFDSEYMAKFIRAQGFVPSWHYHLVDVEALMAGKLGIAPPWKSTDLAEQLGVTITDEDRHTAMGDTRWARNCYYACIGFPTV